MCSRPVAATSRRVGSSPRPSGGSVRRLHRPLLFLLPAARPAPAGLDTEGQRATSLDGPSAVRAEFDGGVLTSLRGVGIPPWSHAHPAPGRPVPSPSVPGGQEPGDPGTHEGDGRSQQQPWGVASEEDGADQVGHGNTSAIGLAGGSLVRGVPGDAGVARGCASNGDISRQVYSEVGAGANLPPDPGPPTTPRGAPTGIVVIGQCTDAQWRGDDDMDRSASRACRAVPEDRT